ncbi:alpha/beta hydrolase (plasmid) [Mesorhizobium sp. AR02]|uniref:alpha/beta hydrolase n=1 Tax=Mesorhizobium sp. AR02 TaxID=2865837 RepID=UPI0021609B87|nr:alpha/beta hydrolase [Mesorhizobium sp. AR02]UVK49714.1 alpha/beta hydrolase [Mesorhizobium sp. AR02]
MYIDPEVKNLFAKINEQPAPSMDQLSVADARQRYCDQSAVLGGPVVAINQVADFAAEGPAGAIPLRLYRPDGVPEDAAPALIYIHGGGWVIGSIESHDRVCRQIAHRASCAVISVEYRLAPEHPAPAAAEDVISALIWIVDHATEIGVDAGRLAVGGDSAGGSLTAVAALAARDAGIPLRCQILIYPATDNRDSAWSYPSRIAYAEVPPLTRPIMEYFRESFLPDKTAAQDWRVSPLVVESVENVATALVITGSCDVLHDEGVLYADRLEKAGVAVIRRNFPGMVHGFIEMAGVLTATHLALDTIAFVLREQLVQSK